MSIPYKSFFKEEDEEGRPDVFWGNEGAGALFVARDTGRLLLFLRSDQVNEPGTWNLVGGKIDHGEIPKEAVAREVEEETGYEGDYKMSLLYTFRHRDFKYHNFLVIVPFEFTPQLNWEHDTSQWVEYGDWPDPLHFGLADLIRHAGTKIQRVIQLIKKKNGKMGMDEAAINSPPPPPAIVRQVNTPDKSQINQQAITNAYVVAATLWGEARGEKEVGMHAVMNVIMNRAKGDFNKAVDVVFKPKQFSVWNNITNPVERAMGLAAEQRNGKGPDAVAYRKALELVDHAMRGQLPDITGGATYYVEPELAHPKWTKLFIKTKTIGNHDFYKPKAKKKHK